MLILELLEVRTLDASNAGVSARAAPASGAGCGGAGGFLGGSGGRHTTFGMLRMVHMRSIHVATVIRNYFNRYAASCRKRLQKTTVRGRNGRRVQ